MTSDRLPLRVAIVGGGISGIAQAIRLKENLGNRVEFSIIERAGSPGGIWRDSTWPGSGVDIPIHLYSLYSDLKSDWKRVFASQPEVLEYWTELIERHDLLGSFSFNTTYLSSTWSEQDQTHTILLDNGEQYTKTIDILISANGPLSKPLIPDLPGITDFEGVSFHNLRWDASVDFKDKKVAVIGSGSSAVQFIPGLAEVPGIQITQFIRSGGFYFPKVNTEYSAVQKFVYRWFPGALRYLRLRLFLDHNKRWTARNYTNGRGHDALESQLLEYLKDTAPAEYLDALTPKYPLGCKRPAFDAGWLASLHRPNVHLTSSSIERLTKNSVITKDGIETPADIVIFATGSDVAKHGVGLNVGLHGEGGLELQEYWNSLDGPEAYLGLAVPKFPNYFMVLGPNAVAGSWGYTIGNQTAVIARIITEMVDNGISSIQPKEEVFRLHNEELQGRLQQSTMASNQCTSWWRIGQGKVTVANSLNGYELWKETRVTQWKDWVAVAWSDAGGKRHLREVDVDQIATKSKSRSALVLGSIVLSSVLLYTLRSRVTS